jgi:hypothetical protein
MHKRREEVLKASFNQPTEQSRINYILPWTQNSQEVQTLEVKLLTIKKTISTPNFAVKSKFSDFRKSTVPFWCQKLIFKNLCEF